MYDHRMRYRSCSRAEDLSLKSVYKKLGEPERNELDFVSAVQFLSSSNGLFDHSYGQLALNKPLHSSYKASK